MSNSTRIAKNTIALYFRQILIMMVSLYTVRIVLASLGVVDYSKLNTKIIFGNGDAVDFWSGNTKRAPDFMIRLGLEWLFRLFASFSFKRVVRQIKLAKFLVSYKRGLHDVRKME